MGPREHPKQAFLAVSGRFWPFLARNGQKTTRNGKKRPETPASDAPSGPPALAQERVALWSDDDAAYMYLAGAGQRASRTKTPLANN